MKQKIWKLIQLIVGILGKALFYVKSVLNIDYLCLTLCLHLFRTNSNFI